MPLEKTYLALEAREVAKRYMMRATEKALKKLQRLMQKGNASRFFSREGGKALEEAVSRV